MLDIFVEGKVTEFPNSDIFICTLGYENRSGHLARTNVERLKKRIAISFEERRGASYPSNKTFLEQAGFQIIPFDENMPDLVTQEIMETSDQCVAVTIDISSMSRPMMATLVQALRTCFRKQIRATFLYCPAVFTTPDATHSPVTVSGPVIPELAGWSSEPNKPAAAIVGLGYEYDQALGTLEYLEPASAWAFIPCGEDERYERELKKANADFYKLLPPENLCKYVLSDPYSCFQTIEGLTYGLLRDCRPILIPFGPKIFALICILVANIHVGVTVWRVSGDQSGDPTDRVASGSLIGLTVAFRHFKSS
ncbi:MAG: hypothetical protein HQL40_07210 [Alphaproteobacteria bacterium]|nr:hypothetical protein [Alphaproteobacteria bacterium]